MKNHERYLKAGEMTLRWAGVFMFLCILGGALLTLGFTVMFAKNYLPVHGGLVGGSMILYLALMTATSVWTFLFFRTLANVMRLMREGESGSTTAAIAELDRAIRFLMISLFLDAVMAVMGLYEYLVPSISPALVAKVHAEASGGLKFFWDYLIPSYRGTSGWILALLLFCLSQFWKERVRLQQEVTVMKEESNLTI